MIQRRDDNSTIKIVKNSRGSKTRICCERKMLSAGIYEDTLRTHLRIHISPRPVDVRLFTAQSQILFPSA